MRVLITGTGAGVGKTWVACALIRALRDVGKRVIAVKPVETGRSGPPSDWEDGVRLAKSIGQEQPTQAIIRLPLPGAPVLGGEGVESSIDFDALVLKIEGYINGAAALVVAEDRLGTINHTLLTLSALELAGIPCAGVILTTPETTDRSTGANAAAIARLSGVDRVMAVPRAADPDDAAESMVQVVGWLGRVAAPA